LATRESILKKLQAPSPNIQRSSKPKAPNCWRTRIQNISHVSIGVCCFSGAWMLEFGAFHSSP
jgi:hypothetical protein